MPVDLWARNLHGGRLRSRLRAQLVIPTASGVSCPSSEPLFASGAELISDLRQRRGEQERYDWRIMAIARGVAGVDGGKDAARHRV